MNKQRADLTFKHNLKRGRHGWVRLTPAYSVKLVHQILDDYPEITSILDPFSGTGTTGLVAGQRGLRSDLFDVNPFLVWLAEIKCANYTSAQLQGAQEVAAEIAHHSQSNISDDNLWFPPISNIDRWWSSDRLMVLGKIFHVLNQILPTQCGEKDLLLVGFCRLIMRWSNAAFNHQSMSFRDHDVTLRMFDEKDEIYQDFLQDMTEITAAATEQVSGKAQVLLKDSRKIVDAANQQYKAIITSPPYVNRMSYIRELRPYMYWLGYLDTARDAGELDWEAIGGTWGIATSRLNDWMPQHKNYDSSFLKPIVESIAENSVILSRYVHKYFDDMSLHFSSLYDAVVTGGHLFYVIGNSKFYDTVVPAEQLYADLMKQHGFENVKISTIRKRNSKKELYEFLVSACKP